MVRVEESTHASCRHSSQYYCLSVVKIEVFVKKMELFECVVVSSEVKVSIFVCNGVS